MGDATTEKIKEHLDVLKNTENFAYELRHGNALYMNGQAQVLTQSKNRFEIRVDDKFNYFKVQLEINGEIGENSNCKSQDWCSHKIAGLLQVSEILSRFDNDRGVEFLSGMLKMSIGKEFSSSENKIEVNKESGKVVMRFKMPV